jgi:hypothetical protein
VLTVSRAFHFLRAQFSALAYCTLQYLVMRVSYFSLPTSKYSGRVFSLGKVFCCPCVPASRFAVYVLSPRRSSELGNPPASDRGTRQLPHISGSLDLLRCTTRLSRKRNSGSAIRLRRIRHIQKCFTFVLVYCPPPLSSVASSDTVTPRCSRSFASGSAFFFSPAC